MATSTDLNAAIDEVRQNLSEGAGDSPESEADALGGGGALDSLRERLGALPWWVISVIVHATLFFLFVTFFAATRLTTADANDLFVTSEFTEPEEPEVDMEKPRDLFRNPVDAPAQVEIEQPILAKDDPDAEVSDHFETDNDMDDATARGDENAFSTVPLGGTGVVGAIGVGGGGPAGVFGFRNGGGRRKCIKRFGGSKASESAVEAALKWLADHQEPDGHWDCKKHGGSGRSSDLAMSGLATLAFLGAGYTPTTPSKYREKVKKAVEWLQSQQRPGGVKLEGKLDRKYENGSWASGTSIYNHAIAALALAEAYGMTRDEKIGESAQLAVDYSVNVHQKPYAGWRYGPKSEGDMSVSGWFVMQLKSAKVAGLKVDGRAFQGAMNFVDSVTDPETGRTRYTVRSHPSPRRTSMGLVARLFMGASPKSDPLIAKQADYLLEHKPEPFESKDQAGDFYYWYYAMLGMFQAGGQRWRDWNEVMRPRLVKSQCTAADGDDNGSWNYANIAYGKSGGRVFTTALGALTLEVYYRYLPICRD